MTLQAVLLRPASEIRLAEAVKFCLLNLFFYTHWFYEKKIVILFILAGLVGGYFFQSSLLSAEPSQSKNEVLNSNISVVEVENDVEVGIPKRISITEIGVVDVEVESVKEDSKGRMDIPSDHMNAAWYSLGVRPGERGKSVIAAHYDTPEGDPSVFYDLDTLSPGDEIVVEDEFGEILTFEVTRVETYPTDEFPLQEVFGKSDVIALNLITCGGTWDDVKSDYLERTVVYSELKK